MDSVRRLFWMVVTYNRKMAKQQRKVGMIVRIPVNEEVETFGQVLRPPEIAVFNLFRRRGADPSPHELKTAPTLFRVWVMNKAITSGGWRRIGMASLRPEFERTVPRYKRDAITGEMSIYIDGVERPASPAECRGLEPAAVWSAEHVEARLRDHVGGRAHEPLEQMWRGPSRPPGRVDRL